MRNLSLSDFYGKRPVFPRLDEGATPIELSRQAEPVKITGARQNPASMQG
jgi:hypothetical protein